MASPAFAYRIDSVQIEKNLGGSSIYSGQNTITSGTSVQLSYSSDARKVLLKPSADTRQQIYIGGSAVTASNGLELVTDTVCTIDCDAATDIYAIINDDVDPGAATLTYLVIVE